MLRNYLTTIPYTKLILIKDTVQEQGKPIFDFLLKVHLDRPQNRIHYFVFQEPFARAKSGLSHNNIVLHDYVSNVLGWNKDPKLENFEDIVKNVGVNTVIFIDSLAHIIYEYGLAETYRLLNTSKTQSGVQQIIMLLHQDLLEDKLGIETLLDHLCTLSITLLPRFGTGKDRIQYIYKKTGGKILKELEEYWMDNGNLLTEKVKKLDPKQLLEKSLSTEINPETLSTFKIGLSDEEKRTRDERGGDILPYLPKQSGQNEEESGRIFYEFDEVDDWDEEDPDDDLDI